MADRRRILVLSDIPGAPTGFGGQALVLLDAARRAGAEPVALGMSLNPDPEGAEPRVLSDGTRLWRIPYDPPVTRLRRILERERPAGIATLAELWMSDVLARLDEASRRRACLWLALDCPYLPEDRARWLAAAGAAVAVAPYGAKVLAPVRTFGGRVEMVPHGVRRALEGATPREETAARRRGHGLDGAFVALAVGRNQFRKGQPYLLDAWSRFLRDLPPGGADAARLFLHAEQRPAPFAPVTDPAVRAALATQAGWDLPALIERHFPEIAETVEFSDLNAPAEALRHLYGVCDVHVTTTLGEGFGVPIIEAQACGRPNIAPDHTAISDLVGPRPAEDPPGGAPFGWLVPCSHRVLQSDVLEWRPLVDVGAFARALREAWEHWRAGTLNAAEAEERRRAWTFREFGWDAVTDRWAGVLRDVVLS